MPISSPYVRADHRRPVDPIKGGRRPPMVIGVDDRPTNVP